ncbi:MAG: hypothetical protein JOY70_01225 [Acidisphaera sp.]|nr:hypothetical protein [Acidisphaera sp.]MBV9813329.1 hypothetical protein [Acetobacteraceae bacterium]
MSDTDWPGADGSPIACREKLKMLRENEEELAQVLRDAWEDAILMGVAEDAMRERLRGMVAALRSPKAPGKDAPA